MADPTTPNVDFAVPAHGSDVDAWDAPLNSNFLALDGMLGGVASVSLTNVPVTLTAPSGVSVPGPGPNQAQNAILKLTGTLTANVAVTLPLPGYYIIDNQTNGNFVVTLRTAAGGGKIIGMPSGAQMHVFTDGTDVKFANLGFPTQQVFFAGESAMPSWVGACSTPPFLLADGAIYNIADFPALGAKLGAKFGGNGVTTFGVEDLRGRVPLAYDGTGTRITVAGCGIDGQLMGGSGGGQNVMVARAQLPNVPITFTGNNAALNVTSNRGDIGIAPQGIAASGGSGAKTPTGFTSVTSSGFFTPTGSISPANLNGNVTQQTVPSVPPAQVAGVWGVKT